MCVSCSSPKDEDCEHKGLSRSAPGWGLSAFAAPYLSLACPMLRTPARDHQRCDRGGAFRTGSGAWIAERRAPASGRCIRAKALADPEHHDQWIDEAIKWLERAMEAGRRAVEADDGSRIAEPTHETIALHRRIARQ